MTIKNTLLSFVPLTAGVCCNAAMKTKLKPWYRTTGLKHVTGFLTPADKEKLKQLAKNADKSLTRYVSRLLESHVRTFGEKPPKN